MTVARRRVVRAWLGLVAVLAWWAVAPAGATAAAQEDCGGGDVDVVQSADDPTTIVAAIVSGVGAACDGQPVGVQFLGNAQGDPAQAPVELARAYSDEDPCTGAVRPQGVLRGGTVEIPLCAGSTTSGHVDGGQLTRLRLLTTLDPPAVPAAPGEPDPAPVDDLPVTGADVLRGLLVGAALVVVGGGLVRLARRGSPRHA